MLFGGSKGLMLVRPERFKPWNYQPPVVASKILIDRKVVEYLRKMPEQNKFLRGQIAWLGFRQTEVEFDREKRKHGNSSYSIWKMLQFAMDGITSFSNIPLKLVTRLGFLISAISFMIILYAIYSHYILDRTITGWTSLIISSAFIGGIQMISIGIIGEYISRINRNVQGRPLYIIESSNITRDKNDQRSNDSDPVRD